MLLEETAAGDSPSGTGILKSSGNVAQIPSSKEPYENSKTESQPKWNTCGKGRKSILKNYFQSKFQLLHS